MTIDYLIFFSVAKVKYPGKRNNEEKADFNLQFLEDTVHCIGKAW